MPVGGAAAIVVDGKPILSKRHGVADLRVHVPLRFNGSSIAPSADDLLFQVAGGRPGIIFEDASGANLTETVVARARSISLIRPDGGTEIHVLDGRLLLSDGTDATSSCGTGIPEAWSAPEAFTTFEFGLLPTQTGVIALSLEGEAADDSPESWITLAMHADSKGARALTVGGAAQFIVDGVDVHSQWRGCQTPPT